MCKFASFVLTKDKEFWLADSDSHEEIIRRYNLHADGVRGPNIVRVELTPGPELLRFDQYASWLFRIDQDVMPKWASLPELEGRTRLALLRRASDGFRIVYASGCAALTKLEVPSATYVEARGCAALTQRDAGIRIRR